MSGWWRKPDHRSEYGGAGTLPSTLFPKGTDALTNDDKIRLDNLTGQNVDPAAPLNTYTFYGVDPPEDVEEGPTEQQIIDAADPY